MGLYRRERRAAAFLSVFDGVKSHIREMAAQDEEWRVSIGWAHLAIGRVGEAIAWLRSVDSDRLSAAADFKSYGIDS